MRRLIIIILFTLLATPAFADTHTSASCSLANVNTAISAATEGDTVQVANGSCDWGSSGINLTKFITLTGGIGTITTTGTMVNFTPATPANNGTFRVTGFTANVGIFVSMQTTVENGTTKMTHIRIDHNTVTSSDNMINVDNANFWGVVDSNTFTNGSHMDIYGPGCTGWLSNTYAFGTSDNLYFEDNTIISQMDAGVVNSLGFGGRVLFRYNTISYRAGGQFYGFDIHGNQGLNHTCGSKGGEYYGNRIDNNGTNSAMKQMDHRDGRVMNFFNRIVSTGATWISSRNECNDNQNPAGYTVDDGGMPMHLNDSYYFNIRNSAGVHTEYGGSNIANGSTQNCEGASGTSYTIAENQDFWGYKSSFNGTVGVGCGILASRPATCTTGVGYFATTDSCTSISDANVGANPETPISGTFYKCTATNTWTAYYTPYTYPHPLRSYGPTDITAPVVSFTTSSPQNISADSLAISGTATDAVGVTACYYNIGAPVDATHGTLLTGTTSWSGTITGFANGANTLYAGCRDAAANFGNASIMVNYTLPEPPGGTAATCKGCTSLKLGPDGGIK